MTIHSEFGALEKVFLKPVENAFISQEELDANWKDFHFLSVPNYEKAVEEYREFQNLLANEGVEILYFPKDGSTGMDSVYCRDASIVTDKGIIICNMGKDSRNGEPTAAFKEYASLNHKILWSIEPPGMVEGGDVAWLDDKTLAVAHGYRTNDDGFQQLRRLLEPQGIECIQVDLPHYKGEQDVFHLMSIFSPVDEKKAVVYLPYMPVRFRQELLSRGYELIEVPDEEFESMGCNVLAIAPSKCIMVKGNPITKNRLEKAGCTVMEYSGSEISVKGGGGPTCLTRPFLRK